MKTINVKIYWADKNYCCGWNDDVIGSIVCTHKTLEGVKRAFEESLDFHMEGLQQRERIVEGLHRIGEAFLAIR